MFSVLFFFLKAQRVLSVSSNGSWVETFSPTGFSHDGWERSPSLGLRTVRNCKARGGPAEGEADLPGQGPGLFFLCIYGFVTVVLRSRINHGGRRLEMGPDSLKLKVPTCGQQDKGCRGGACLLQTGNFRAPQRKKHSKMVPQWM